MQHFVFFDVVIVFLHVLPKSQDAMADCSPLLWELLSKLLLDSRAERNKIRAGEALVPAAVLAMLKRRLDAMCAPHQEDEDDEEDAEESDGSDGSDEDEEEEDDGSSASKRASGDDEKDCTNTVALKRTRSATDRAVAEAVSTAKKGKHGSGSGSSDDDEADAESVADEDDEDGMEQDDGAAEMDWTAPAARRVARNGTALPHLVCGGWNAAAIVQNFDPADYWACAPSHPLAALLDAIDDENASSSSSSSSSRKVSASASASSSSSSGSTDLTGTASGTAVRAWRAVPMHERVAIVKALADVRVASDEFRDVLAALESAADVRLRPFALDTDQQAYYDFGFRGMGRWRACVRTGRRAGDVWRWRAHVKRDSICSFKHCEDGFKDAC